MPDISIHRDHTLGLKEARKVASQWAQQVERDHGLTCVASQGKDSDVIEFSRSGVAGTLRVTADAFDLKAKLGFLLGVFSKTIEAEILKALDGLLKDKATPAAKAPAKRATRRA